MVRSARPLALKNKVELLRKSIIDGVCMQAKEVPQFS